MECASFRSIVAGGQQQQIAALTAIQAIDSVLANIDGRDVLGGRGLQDAIDQLGDALTKDGVHMIPQPKGGKHSVWGRLDAAG